MMLKASNWWCDDDDGGNGNRLRKRSVEMIVSISFVDIVPFAFNNKLFRLVPVFRTIPYYTVSHGCIVQILI